MTSGTSGPIGAWDDVTPTANEEAHGTAVAGTQAGAANAASSANRFVYDYTAMDGLAIKAAYTPSDGTGAVSRKFNELWCIIHRYRRFIYICCNG